MSGRAATTTVAPGRWALSVGPAGMPAPKGWKWIPLDQLARLESGHTPSRKHPEYWDGEIPWIGIKDARDNHGGTISSTLQYVTQKGLDNSASRLLPRGTVCLSRTASVGYVVVMGEDMATSQDFVNWVCSEDLDPEFLQKLFIAEKESLLEFGKGTVHKTIYFPEVKAFRVCVPPVREQRKIVAKLNALQTRSRAAREALDAVGPLLEKFRQSVLAAAFRGDLTADWRAKNPDVEPASVLLDRIRKERRHRWEEDQLAKMKAKGKAPKDDRWKAKYVEPKPVDTEGLPELPNGWCWASLDELLAEGLANGRSVKTRDGGFPVLRLTALRSRSIDLSERKCGAWDEEAARPYLVRKGDFLISRGNGSRHLVGRGSLVTDEPDPVAYPDTMIRIRPGRFLTPHYLAVIWESPGVRAQLEGRAKTTAGIHKVSQGDLEKTWLPLPTLDEQQQVARQVRRVLHSVEALVGIAGRVSCDVGTLERAVLSSAFRGCL